jgi:serine/threonine protein kinase
MWRLSSEKVADAQRSGMIGEELGKYKILEELGSSSASTDAYAYDRGLSSDPSGADGNRTQVFEAVDLENEKLVVIRIFPATVAEDQQLLALLQEYFKAVSKISHPGVLPVIGSGMHWGRPYIVMPKMPSGSLVERFQWGTLSTLDMGRIIGEIANILNVAHEKGVVHGELKPTNILFDEEGNVHLAGLGCAPIVGLILQSKEHDIDNHFIYSAPEVLEGTGISAASDQYSFAMIALEMLSRQPADEMLQLIRRYQISSREQGTQPIFPGSNLTPQLVEVFKRALAEDPDQRFVSLQGMVRSLLNAMGFEIGSQSEPEPFETSVSQPKPEKRRRRRLPVAAFATLTVLVLCFVVAIPVLSSSQDGSSNLFTTIWSLVSPDDSDSKSGDTPHDPIVGELPPIDESSGPVGDNPDNPDQPPALVDTPSPDNPTDPTAPSTEDAKSTPAPTSTNDPKKSTARVFPDETHSPTPTPLASDTPISTPTDPPPATPTPVTPVDSPTPTSTLPPTATPIPPTPEPPTQVPTIDPSKCKSNPKTHPRYCTPTP